MQSLEALVSTHAAQIRKGGADSVWLGDDIPAKKLTKAINAYASEVSAESVLALCDTTRFGSAKEGFLITRAGFYCNGSGRALAIRFAEVVSVMHQHEQAVLVLNDGCEIYFTEDEGVSPANISGFFQAVLEARQAGLTDDVDCMMIVEDMPAAVKLAYLQAIIKMTHVDDGVIDKKELAELQLLMAQLKFSAPLRASARAFIVKPDASLDSILAELDTSTPRGSERGLHISLIKDMIRVLRSSKAGASYQDVSIIVDTAERYGINDEQVRFLDDACAFDEQVLKGALSEKALLKHGRDLASKAGAVGVPLAAVYLSGSVMGLSAAGITSGLATLGLGGLFGLSGMVTGIGMVVLLGVGVYKGAQWLTGGRGRDFAAQREQMIQEVLRLHQETINNLTEDINYFASRIVILSRQTTVQQKQIERLALDLQVFSQAISVIHGHKDDFSPAVG